MNYETELNIQPYRQVQVVFSDSDDRMEMKIGTTSNSFKQISMTELRVKLPKLRRQVQPGNLRFVTTHYGEVAAYVLPLSDVDNVLDEEGDPIVKRWEEMPLTKFRDELTNAWELLLSGTDCVYLTFHNRRVVAFVSPRLTRYLSLPIPLTAK